MLRRSVGAHQQPLAQGFCVLVGDDEGVLRVARGVVGREVERLEVVEVGLNLGPERGGVAEPLEDHDDLRHRLDERVLRAEGVGNGGEGGIDAYGALRFAGCCRGMNCFDLRLEFVEAHAE